MLYIDKALWKGERGRDLFDSKAMYKGPDVMPLHEAFRTLDLQLGVVRDIQA